MIRIAPSVLAADMGCLERDLRQAEEGGADLLHVDVMDGHFVPNITFGPMWVEAIRKRTTLHLDVHLMITDPDRYIRTFAESGADALSVHVEACERMLDTLALIGDQCIKAAVAINPGTPVECLWPFLPHVDHVLVMSVQPGFGAQTFIPSVYAKIKRLHDYVDRHGLRVDIAVDGGVNAQTAEAVRQAGATILVAGSAIFRSNGVKTAIQTLRGPH